MNNFLFYIASKRNKRALISTINNSYVLLKMAWPHELQNNKKTKFPEDTINNSIQKSTKQQTTWSISILKS